MSAAYEFEKVLDENGAFLWVGARAQESPQRFYVWVPNTQFWHRYPEFEPGPGYVEDIIFEPCTAGEVQRIQLEKRRINERTHGWVVDEFRSQPESEVRSSVELGLPVSAGVQPTRAVNIDDMPAGEWMTLKEYPREGYRRAISLASDIRQGKRKKLVLAGYRLEAKVEAKEDGYALVIRKVQN